jgi:hypothetical protein
MLISASMLFPFELDGIGLKYGGSLMQCVLNNAMLHSELLNKKLLTTYLRMDRLIVFNVGGREIR